MKNVEIISECTSAHRENQTVTASRGMSSPDAGHGSLTVSTAPTGSFV